MNKKVLFKLDPERYQIPRSSYRSPPKVKKMKTFDAQEPNSKSDIHDRIWKSLGKDFEKESNKICDFFGSVSLVEDPYKTPAQKNIFNDARREIYLGIPSKTITNNVEFNCKKTFLFPKENDGSADKDSVIKDNKKDETVEKFDFKELNQNYVPFKFQFPIFKTK